MLSVESTHILSASSPMGCLRLLENYVDICWFSVFTHAITVFVGEKHGKTMNWLLQSMGESSLQTRPYPNPESTCHDWHIYKISMLHHHSKDGHSIAGPTHMLNHIPWIEFSSRQSLALLVVELTMFLHPHVEKIRMYLDNIHILKALTAKLLSLIPLLVKKKGHVPCKRIPILMVKITSFSSSLQSLGGHSWVPNPMDAPASKYANLETIDLLLRCP